MSQSTQEKKAQRDLKADAAKIVRTLSISGDNRAETQRIVVGVQRGIEYHLKHQSAKARALDKKAKKLKQVDSNSEAGAPAAAAPDRKSSSAFLPWGLLTLSWVSFVGYLMFEAWF